MYLLKCETNEIPNFESEEIKLIRTFQFSLSHSLAVMTLFAVQLGIVALALENDRTELLNEAGTFLALLILIYIPIVLGSRHGAKKQLGSVIATINNPINHSRAMGGSIGIFAVCIFLLFLNQNEIALRLSCLNLVHLSVAAIMPSAILGELELSIVLESFTPWQEWEIVPESRSSSSAYMVLKARMLVFSLKIFISKKFSKIRTIELSLLKSQSEKLGNLRR